MSTKDHEVNPGELLRTLKLRAREHYLQDARLIEITPIVKRLYPKLLELYAHVDVTNNLAAVIAPYGEDRYKDVSFEERVGDMLKHLPKATVVNSVDWPDPQLNFEFGIRTYVSKKHAGVDEVDTFKDGKARDKRVPVYAMTFPNASGKSGLLLGLRKD
jgi:hypothetical protein